MFARKMAALMLLMVLTCFSCAKNAEGAKGSADVEATGSESSESGSRPTDYVQINDNALKVKRANGETVEIAPCAPSNTCDDVAYALAMQIIGNIKGIYSEVYGREQKANLSDSEIGSFLQGLLDAENGRELDYGFMMDIGNRLQADADAKRAKSREAAENYFKSLEAREDIIKTDSGLMYEVIAEGDGNGGIDSESKVNVDYVMSVYQEGAPDNKVEADSNQDIDFIVSNLIPGAIEGLKLMREGSEYVFYINPELGYGPVAVSPVIGPDSYLIFKVKVNKIHPDETPEDSEAPSSERTE
ncbi:MAG TPA: hypothetical protein DCO86_03510 [Spirochaetaceae bacterium]|nr:hypothetical protein [Spirochaetaceae bacterium]